MKRIAPLSILGCSGLLFAASTCFAQMYTVTDLGTLGGSQSLANGINASGQVVGWSYTAGDNFIHAFRTAPNSPINPRSDDLHTLAGVSESVAYGINDSGQVAGVSFLPGNKVEHAFRTAPNKSINPAKDDLGTLGGTSSYGYGINSSGQVVGVSLITGNLGEHAFRTAANSHINPNTDDLGTLGGAFSPFVGGISYAQGINESGQVVGWSLCINPLSDHAFRTAPNSSIIPATDDLGAFPRTPDVIPTSYGYGINVLGQAIGYSFVGGATGPPTLHAFRTAPNSSINPATDDLGTLGGVQSYAQSINASGQVVGYSFLSDNSTVHAFLYGGGAIYDLNTLIPPGSGWELVAAYGINDAAQIVGEGIHNSQVRAFLLTTSDEPVVQQPTNADESSVSATMEVVPVCWRDARLHGSPACARQLQFQSWTR